jgi:glutamate-ammonia-ligase adenylyltransferase
VQQLANAYQFLRQLIEALRVVRGNAKDLTIPATGTREFDHLSRRMRYDSPDTLAGHIEQRMTLAQNLWNSTAN